MEAEAESRNGKRKRETETEKTETGTTRTTTRTTTCKWSRGPLARTTRSLGRGSPLHGAAPRSGRHSYAIGNRGWRPEHQNHLQITPKPLARPLANLIDHSPDHLHDLARPLARVTEALVLNTPLEKNARGATTCKHHLHEMPTPLARPLARNSRPLARHAKPLANTTCADHLQKWFGRDPLHGAPLASGSRPAPRSKPKPLARPLAPNTCIPWSSHSQTTCTDHSHRTTRNPKPLAN